MCEAVISFSVYVFLRSKDTQTSTSSEKIKENGIVLAKREKGKANDWKSFMKRTLRWQ